MDGQLKKGRRLRSRRERVCRLRNSLVIDAQSPNSSCSDSQRRHSPGRDIASVPDKKHCAAAARAPRRKRRGSSSQEEDIIDGFAIVSFFSLDRLQKKSRFGKTRVKKERWKDKKKAQQQKKEEEEIKDENENVQPAEDPLEDGFLRHVQREQERINERLLKKTYSKKNKMIKPLAQRLTQVIKEETDQDQGHPDGSDCRDRFSERDGENEVDDKVSDVGSTKFFSPTAPTGAVTHESPESRTCGAAKFSGIPRSQERSNGEVLFTPPVPSPTPAWVPTGSPAPAAAAAPLGSPLPKFSPLTIKKEELPAHAPTSPPLLRPLPHAQPHPEERVLPSLQHDAQRVISHQGQHHPLQLGSFPLISSSSPVGFTRPPLPQAFQHKPGGLLPSPPALPLSIPGLSPSEYSYLRSPAHRHPAMFATSAALPPPPTLPTNSLVVPGHPGAVPYPDTSLLISFNQPIMYCQPHSGILIGTLSQATLLPPPMSSHVENPHSMSWRNRECQFDKYTPKMDNPFFRHSNFFPSYPPTMPGMPPLLPHSGPFSSLQGAFQPKASNPNDVATRPGAVPHTLLQKDPRVTDPFRTSVRKPGKWCAVHVQIAWQIYHHQQKMKMQLDPHKLDMSSKLDLFSRPPVPGVFPGLPYSHDLARPLFSTTGSGHPVPPSYGPAPHPSSFLPPSHLADPFGRSTSFGSLGSLSTSAFGGLGNPTLGSNSVFGMKEGPGGLPTFGSPHHDAWNRLRRTPPSFPIPPQWPKTTEAERSSSANSQEREPQRDQDREIEKRESSLGGEEKDKDRDSSERNRHSSRSSPAAAPVGYHISNLIRSNSQSSGDLSRHPSGNVERVREAEKELLDPHRDSSTLADVKVKESRPPGHDVMERRSSEDSVKSSQRSPSPYLKAMISDQSVKMAGGPQTPLKEIEKEHPPVELLHKVKNDMKIKEERKEEQEVMVVSSEPSPQPPAPALPASVGQLINPHHHHPPLPQQHPLSLQRGGEIPASSLHVLPMAHSLPLSMSGMPHMGSLNVLDRARMAPFMGVSPLAGRERFTHPAFAWDPFKEAYRSLDLQRRMDLQLRAEQGHRYASAYEQERAHREREAHDYSHHEHLMEVRREHERLRQQAEERERLHLREELDRARLHQLHQSPVEGHLPHMPPFMPHLGGMPYPRLSPSTGHNVPLNRTPPTAALSAPPPLVPAGGARPASPRRTTPLTTTQDPRDYSPSRNPKEVEAR